MAIVTGYVLGDESMDILAKKLKIPPEVMYKTYHEAVAKGRGRARLGKFLFYIDPYQHTR